MVRCTRLPWASPGIRLTLRTWDRDPADQGVLFQGAVLAASHIAFLSHALSALVRLR